MNENILGMIAIASMAVGVIGGFVLIGFRNLSNEKSMTMMHIWGMQRRDLCLKASIDAVLYGFLSTCLGFVLGYLLFLHFAGNKLQGDIAISLLSISFQSLKVFLKVLVLIVCILVTAAVFYSVISSDLTDRKTESYLYRVFGASFGSAQKVIFHEYTLIALISSFAVSFCPAM